MRGGGVDETPPPRMVRSQGRSPTDEGVTRLHLRTTSRCEVLGRAPRESAQVRTRALSHVGSLKATGTVFAKKGQKSTLDLVVHSTPVDVSVRVIGHTHDFGKSAIPKLQGPDMGSGWVELSNVRVCVVQAGEATSRNIRVAAAVHGNVAGIADCNAERPEATGPILYA